MLRRVPEVDIVMGGCQGRVEEVEIVMNGCHKAFSQGWEVGGGWTQGWVQRGCGMEDRE